MAEKYYAVKHGRLPGIYLNWEECQAQVIGFNEASFKSFETIEEAKAFLADANQKFAQTSKYVAYIDGSFNVKTNEYSFGGVLITPEKEYHFKKKYEADEFSQFRNVAGEIKGAGFMIQYAINHHIEEIDIYYDYEGIRSWYDGLWKANNFLTKSYKEFALANKGKIKVNFIKVKSHSNDQYNDMADELAKDALGIK